MDTPGKRRDSTLATEDTGDTPSPPVLVKATPSAEKNRLVTNSAYRFTSSFDFTQIPSFPTHYTSETEKRESFIMIKSRKCSARSN